MNGKTFGIVCLVAAITLVSGPLQAQERTVHLEEGWEFTLAPYVWFAGIDGDVTVKGTTSEVDADFGDISDSLDAAALGYFEVRNGKWGAYTDVVYLDASRNGKVGAANIEVGATSTILEAGALYRAYEGHNQDYPVATDIFFGARYMNIEAALDFTGAGDVQEGKDWVDPIIGATHLRDFSEKVTLTAGGDVGGLGIGSDFTYSLRLLLGYRFTEHVNGWIGYRYLDIDDDDGSGANQFVYDVALHGPILGASIHF